MVFNEGRPGVVTDRGSFDVSKCVLPFGGHDGMCSIIQRFDELEPTLTELAREADALPMDSVTLTAPLPRATVLAMGGNYRENGAREPSPMWGFLKSTDAIVGSGATIVLPDVDANIFHHEAELVVVFGKAGDHIPEQQAMEYVFGFTCGVDVSARMPPPPGGAAVSTERGCLFLATSRITASRRWVRALLPGRRSAMRSSWTSALGERGATPQLQHQ